MLTDIATCKARMGVTDTAHDAHITSLLLAAHDIVAQHLRQRIERGTATYRVPCIAVTDDQYCIARPRASIDVSLSSVSAAGADITALCSYDAERNVVRVPTDYEGYMLDVTLTSGWTSSSVPQVVVGVLCELTYHMYVSTSLAANNLAGVASLSTSVSGVTTESRTYRDDYVQRVLSRLDRWRLNLW
jgi:hypothetical protein